MGEELTIAIDVLRRRPFNQVWFIPVLLDAECEVPDIGIGRGKTLRSINWVALYDDWEEGIQSVSSVIKPVGSPPLASHRQGVHPDETEEEAQPRVAEREVPPQTENDSKSQEASVPAHK